MFSLRRAAVALFTVLVAALLASCDLVTGDSLVVQAATTGQTPFFAAEETKDGVTLKGVSGIAPCDYERTMAADYAKHKPKRISLAFSGNNATACVAGKTGVELVENYRASLERITRYFSSKGVAVILSAPVCVRPGVTWSNGDPAFRVMERALAASLSAQRVKVAYSEYAATRVCPGWVYTPSLRHPDGIHLSRTGAVVFAAALRYENKNTVIR